MPAKPLKLTNVTKHNRLLKLNDIVEITWLDSGIGGIGKPSSGKLRLVFNTTYGRVSYLGQDPEIHTRLCEPRGLPAEDCRCSWVVLAMCCSNQSSEARADLAGIWIHSITRVRKLGKKKPEAEPTTS